MCISTILNERIEAAPSSKIKFGLYTDDCSEARSDIFGPPSLRNRREISVPHKELQSPEEPLRENDVPICTTHWVNASKYGCSIPDASLDYSAFPSKKDMKSDDSSTTFSNQGRPLKEMKRSYSFAGFGLLSARPSSFELQGPLMTTEELDDMIHPTKKEITKSSKQQIKIFAKKYKHMQQEQDKEKVSWYKEALEHTQAAHLVTILAIVYLAFRLFPDSRRGASEASTLTRLLYVSSISTVFGAQIWMTFVSGLSLFFTLPRHIFASVQAVLFPIYFLFNAALMLVVIVTYTQHHPTHLWETHQLIQGIALVFCFIVNLFIRLYLAPVLTKLITVKMAIESETGLGNEIGTNQPGVLSRCPHYMKLYRTFRKVHMSIALGNMAAMAATSFHLYYLATKLCSIHV